MSMINEDQRMQCAPPRVLFEAGRWAVSEEERPAGWREMARERQCTAPEPRRNLEPVGRQQPERSAKLKQREVRNAERHKVTGRGRGWRLKAQVTAAKIVELRRQHGWGMERIAKHVGCSYCAVRARLHADAAALAEFAALARICECGVEIRTEHAFCGKCRFNRPAHVRAAANNPNI